MLLDQIHEPADLRRLSLDELEQLAAELRQVIVDTVTTTGGHLGSNLGAVELTLALHRVFDSPRDVLLWDTGHQAYVHKLVTGRRERFATLRQPGGLSGYPNRAESPHDWIENSHASTALSYAHGVATALRLRGEGDRRVVAVVGDGSLTGGMAFEALNNLGHSGSRVVIVLNDNGRSYAPTISKLSVQLSTLRLNPAYVQARERVRELLRAIPGLGDLAYSSVHGLTSALREVVTPHQFFEALGIRYAGPFDGHDLATMEQAFAHAAEWDGPILVHVVTHKGKGYAPAEEDEVQRLHDLKVQPRPASVGVNGTGSQAGLDVAPVSYTDAFTRAILDEAARRPELVAITAAMPGPTGLLPFQSAHPERFLDVGIAEQHAVTAAAGMAMAGLRPVVAVYSTFFCRAFDQATYDVGLHRLPVCFVLDRAGVTGDDGPSHHGLLDLALCLSIPGMTVFAPSSAEEVPVMLHQALELPGPSAIRFPKTPARRSPDGVTGEGLKARRLRQGDGSVCLLAVGKLVQAALEAADLLATRGIEATVYDVRVVAPPDLAMLADAARHELVVTAEDGVAVGGAGTFLLAAMADLPELDRALPPARTLGTPRRFLAHGKPDQILAELGLDGPGLARSVEDALTLERARARLT
ncbi:1-deoxy-D-xylulose-5-phosphate synthase [Aciditerrimonas ferrireducens]|jgi:1-deoxy-D-xylulose-5-phosphate synthase|uniref:1-deoxy-D-xylulose-5-phosphate synthase n=1 Tax=Aciditerrimonas ferrireducens TaxID=667306 RepID=A0ABV6C460_9ACTN|nr:1-deoxy-D-xylulose-5-phosphate synthase [Aciditerrimonas ferrireducens]MCK4176553.1 1-deoxy-D-xylulose-5-phosphate synthase [Aciditerrimonas ferrireducens]